VSKKIRVLLADDHALVRGTVALWLQNNRDFDVVGAVQDAERAVEEAVRIHPDIVLLDIDMPGLNAFEAARIIRSRCPHTHLVFLSGHVQDHYIEQALSAGAAGYVTKDEPAETVARAIRTVADGGAYFSPEVQKRIVVDVTGPRLEKDRFSRFSTLSPREVEVLRYLARGMSKKEIASTMTLSVGTINNHSANLMRKLDIHDRVELTRFAIREGLTQA